MMRSVSNFVASFNIQYQLYLSRGMRKPVICICKNKGTDQLLIKASGFAT